MIRPLLFATVLFVPAALPAQVPAPAAPAAQPPRTESRIRTDGNGFTLPAGEIELGELIDAAATFLNRNILVNETEMAAAGHGNTSFVLQKQIVVDALGCEDLVYSLLYTKGFAVIPLDAQKGFYEVVSLNGPRGREVMSRAVSRSAAEVLRRPTLREYVLVTVPLQNINATVATNALRPFFASTGNQGGGNLTLGNVGNNTSILLMGFGDQVAAAIRMLQECDKAPPADDQPKPLQDRVASLEAMLARLQAQIEALGKGK